jgi:hypothetical protein
VSACRWAFAKAHISLLHVIEIYNCLRLIMKNAGILPDPGQAQKLHRG